MKRTVTLILLILSGTALFAGPDSLFIKANELYSSARFEEALDHYNQVVESGYISSGLYYNMGNAAYRSNQLGYAILYYEKALKLNPRNEEARRNLEFVSMYREDNLEAVPELFLKQWYKNLVMAFAVNTWSVFSIVLFVLLLTGVLAYIFGRRLWVKQTGFFGGVLALILFALALTATVKRTNQFSHPDTGIVLAPSVVVKSTPGTSGTDLFILHEGTRVYKEEVVGEWIEIRISDGRVGWLHEKAIGLI